MLSTICVKKDTTLGSLVLVFAALWAPHSAMAVESHPGIDVESSYSEAVLAYNKKQTEEAIRLLNAFLAAHPDHAEGLELMALTLKEKGDDQKALEVYKKLLTARPENERGPYYFETAMIYNKLKKPGLAKPHFEASARLGFNRSTSHLFLGLIAFNSGDLNGAEASFKEVRGEAAAEMRLLAHYYLGLIHFKNGYGSGGTSELTQARSLARDLPGNAMARNISENVDKILAPFNTDQWFGNITALSEYDSNIARMPSGIAAAEASRKSTPNLLLNGGIGYMSSPTATVQWVGNYRFNGNKTLNAQTKSYEYFANTPALFLNFKPLSRTTGGLKLDGNLTFNNFPNASGAYVFQKYSSYVGGGAFFRMELAKNIQGEIEANGRKITHHSDLTQSGNSKNARLSLRAATASPYLNPGAVISYEDLSTEGTESSSGSLDLGLSNGLKLSGADTLNLSVDLIQTRYPRHSVGRKDTTLNGRISFLHQFSAKLAALAELTVTNNTSNHPESYSYNRVSAGAGIGWTL